MGGFFPLAVVLLLCLLSVSDASRFRFTLTSRNEECFLEEVNARSSDNTILFRFAVLEPESYDLVDVVVRSTVPNCDSIERSCCQQLCSHCTHVNNKQVKSTSQREVLKWKAEQNNFASAAVRENGLYHLCFRKLKGASSTIALFYSFDFIPTGVQSLSLAPDFAATVSVDEPQVPIYTHMAVTTVKGQARKLGVMEFDLTDVSHSIMHSNTRVRLLLTVDGITGGETVDIALALLPDRLEHPVTWDSLGDYATGGYVSHLIGFDGTELGGHVSFDITDVVDTKLTEKAETIAFSIHGDENGDAVVIGIAHHGSEDHFPQIVVEVYLKMAFDALSSNLKIMQYSGAEGCEL
uniref:GOLD domain-containing protein n=1 Tax=Hyaloperonospora arabidopsidis (strain Emoy2) TaxID=559515 RepID=M4BTH1_HYAAE